MPNPAPKSIFKSKTAFAGILVTAVFGLHGLSREGAKNLALVGKWSVLVFVFLVVLNQLGIASDLIRILFAGVVAMVALAGGLAFGLGGKEVAREVLEKRYIGFINRKEENLLLDVPEYMVRDLKFGDIGTDVQELQEELRRFNFLKIESTGNYGEMGCPLRPK